MANSNTVNLNTVNLNTVNLNTVSLYFRLFRSKDLPTNDLELTVPELYFIRELGNIVMPGYFHAMDNTRW